MKRKALILGASGGIGSATRTAFLNADYQVITVPRTMMDFDQADSEIKLIELLKSAQADVVVNAVGVFVDGAKSTHHQVFNVNFGSNWSIIRHYYDLRHLSKPVKIIMIGSSSYNNGRAMYPLYSASKAALYNLWQASVDMFNESNITVDLINPMRTKTNMNIGHFDPKLSYHDPAEVASRILELSNTEGSNCMNMTLEEKK